MTTVLATVVLSFVVLVMVIAGMAIGVMRGRPPISGSCGGIAGSGCALCKRRRRGHCPAQEATR